jgi:uncharacterized sulfatase
MTSHPNILWLTLDSVRQDHTTMGGYERETTRTIQRLADSRNGVAFSSCFSHARASATSIPSMLSGTYPSRHRTYYGDSTSFPEELPLVSELLADVGYHTVGVSNNGYASSLTSVDRGFDEFVLLGSTPAEILRSAGIRAVLKYVRNIRTHSVGFDTDVHAHSGAYLLTEIAKRQVRKADPPLFMYVHYNEPHRAYYPPLPYLDRFTDDLSMSGAEAAELAMEVHHNLLEIVARGCDLTAEEFAALKAMYDAEIAYTDDLVGELIEFAQTQLTDTVVVVTADHGELFGEDGMLAHKYSMHNAVLNVPLVISGVQGLSDEGLVQHTDVMRTLLETIGADTESIQGVDLHRDTRQYAISQSPLDSFDPLLEYNPEFDTSQFCADPYSVIQNGEFKYVQRPDAPRLYRLPDETENVINVYPDVADELDRELTEWLDTDGTPVGRGDDVELDETMRSRLADLGYLDHEM